MPFNFRYHPKNNCNIIVYIYIFFFSGSSSKGPEKDYSLSSNRETRIFGIFNSLAIIATTYGNGIIPEIQVIILLFTGVFYI